MGSDAVRIRRAALSDADAICALNRDSLGYDYPPELTRERLAELLPRASDAVFVAESGGETAGYVHASDYELLYAPKMKNILGIAVSERFRGKGIGRALLRAVEDWARDTGVSTIRLVSGETRTGAHEFYRRCGYVCGKKQLNFKKNV